jgi:hypothetical protein
MMKNQHVVFLCNRGARFPLMIIEGLLKKNIEVDVSHTFYYLGSPILKKSSFEKLKEKLLACNYIFRVQNEHFVNRKKYDKFMDENNLWNKCVMIDFADTYYIRDKKEYKKCLIYFKRSWLIGKKRKIPAKREKVFPIQYSILEKYITSVENHNPKRIYNVLFVASKRLKERMRDFNKGILRILISILPKSIKDLNRNYIKKIRKEIRQRLELRTRRFKTYYELLCCDIPNKLIGAYTGGTLYDIFYPSENNNWVEYMKLLKKAKIIFTAFPWNHDGDSRTWEAIISGALIFMDKTLISENSFEDGQHLFYFDASSRKSIKKAIKKAEYYLRPENEEERKKIAEQGRNFALKHHKAKNRIEYIFDCIEKIEDSK